MDSKALRFLLTAGKFPFVNLEAVSLKASARDEVSFRLL